ncbi:MAG: PhoX family protein, partial [Planctomycetota bacterium]
MRIAAWWMLLTLVACGSDAAPRERGTFEVANVDNLLIDRNGGVWFGTDGNFSTNGTADAVYYLDLDPAHAATSNPTFGKAFRIVGGPSDSEATGPAFTPDAGTFFFSVQHPGEGRSSDWPPERTSASLRARDDRPLSSVVAAAFVTPLGLEGAANPPTNIETYVKAMVDRLNDDPAWAVENGVAFPLANRTTDTVRAISGLRLSTVARWLDPLGADGANPELRFGANCDYISFFGDGWSGTPLWSGAADRGWMWVNHEYVSNGGPKVRRAPTGQRLTLALLLQDAGVLGFDVRDRAQWDQAAVDIFVEWHKRQLGGSWMRVAQDPATKIWSVDRNATNLRYDATSKTLLRLTGPVNITNSQRDDEGNALATQVAVGLIGDCAGGTTPWGTIISAEENVQSYYGDLENWWSDDLVFDPAGGAKAGGTVTAPIAASSGAAFGLHSDVTRQHKDRDAYGFLAEIDVGVDPAAAYDPTSGVGHQKLGAMGRIRWENATVVVDDRFQLIAGRPLVLYGGNDRRGGRVYKFVSSNPVLAGMTRTQIRNLLADGTLFVSHFADLDHAGGYLRADGEELLDRTGAASVRGSGCWIEMSLTSADVAPNAGASTVRNPTVSVMPAGATVGEALRNRTHNGIGGFGSQSDLLKMLYTAANKIGVMELNRPEDVEWCPHGYGSHGPLLF